jgi:hypothetical protein
MRLAVRVEGAFVSVYLAPPDTLVGASLVSTIDAKYMPNKEDFDTWLDCIRQLLSNKGLKFSGRQHDAPEHERTKNV